MDRFLKVVAGISRIMDRIAGFCLAGVMIMVVVNIILRRLFNSPLLGVYEYVGFLTAVVIGFSLAYCAVKEGHITVDLFFARLPRKARAVLEIGNGFVIFIFLSLVAWYLLKYATGIQTNGQVSQTCEIPFHFFIYLVAGGFFVLSLTALGRGLKFLQGVNEK
ncbi:MAG TPA: TRAP transporter small permease [Firmicutes bacterium]|jgi:TRAP-type C4-dicarboxylate transport system permease small subunit|nr:TRAP transporter small permease [Bacillota bacterium]